VNGPAATIVDGQKTYSCFLLSNGVIEGFTIVNGQSAANGAGVSFGYGGRIENCVLASNTAAGKGGGLYFFGGGEARNCLIVSNSAEYGGGAYLNADGTLRNCTVVDNRATKGGASVGGGESGAAATARSTTSSSGRTTPRTAPTTTSSRHGRPLRHHTGLQRQQHQQAPSVPGLERQRLPPRDELALHGLGNKSVLDDHRSRRQRARPQRPRDMGAYEYQPPVTRFTLTVASPMEPPLPRREPTRMTRGAILTNSVTAADTRETTQYVCAGWALSSHDPASGSDPSMTMTLTNSAALRWLWETNVQFTSTPGRTDR